MSELIDRQALIESFRECYSGHLGMENSDSMLTFRSICRIINNQPTAYDISELQRLKEKDTPKKITHQATLLKCCTCPSCLNVVDKFEKFGDTVVRVEFEYCHFCGQKLDWD